MQTSDDKGACTIYMLGARVVIGRLVARLVAGLVTVLVGHLANTLFVTFRDGESQSESQSGGVAKGHAKAIASLVSPPSAEGPTLEDVGGYERVKTALRQSVVMPLRHPHIFFDSRNPSLRPPGGVLLAGPPGTGKTLFARACALESGVNFLPLHSAALESKWWGESPKLLQAAFKLARTTLAPCIIFFDEIDGLGRKRSEHDQGCVYALKCELLRNMDELHAAGPVTVLACTNCAESLDPALRRRFSKTIRVPLPTREERLSILTVVCKREKRMQEDLLKRLAECTAGFTGADLAVAYREACAARMWRVCNTEADIKGLKNGDALLDHLDALTHGDWTHSARIDLGRQNEAAEGTAATATCVP